MTHTNFTDIACFVTGAASFAFAIKYLFDGKVLRGLYFFFLAIYNIWAGFL